jgi:hypothetical protein
VIRTLGEYCPNLEEAVEEVEVLPPPDIEERFGLVGGNIFQGEMTPDQLFTFRPIPGYGDYRTPVKGLYLCGSGTHPGGGVMAVPARNCAKVCCATCVEDGANRSFRPPANSLSCRSVRYSRLKCNREYVAKISTVSGTPNVAESVRRKEA